MDWPIRGVYFFQEDGEQRSDSGSGPRIVRVGTQAIKQGSKTKLWTRLSQHKGTVRTGGGNHRGSVFRQHVGTALIVKKTLDFPTWSDGSTAPKHIREKEFALEYSVSSIIGNMPFLWLPINDDPGRDSARAHIETNAIALLSNYRRGSIDGHSKDWLGQYCRNDRVREAGIWNHNHVDESYDPAFLDNLHRW